MTAERGSRRMSAALCTGIAFCALLCIAGASLLWGTYPLPASRILDALTGHGTSGVYTVVVDLRLPRFLLTAIAGAMLGIAGVILQALTRNPLAEPSLIGVSQGAVLAIICFMAFEPAVVAITGHGFLFWTQPFAGALGGLGAGLAAYYLAKGPNGVDPSRLILSGILLSAMLSACVTALVFTSQSEVIFEIVLWTIGSSNGRVWSHVVLLLPFAVAGSVAAAASSRTLNGLLLGRDVATGLGLHVERSRKALLLLASLLTAATVAVLGAIAFVGLIGPHVARKLVGNDARRLMPVAASVSAVLLAGANLIAQVFPLDIARAALGMDATGSRGLVLGVVMGFAGVPFFLYLVIKDTTET